MTTSVSRKTTSDTRDRLWPLGESVTVLIGLQVAFYLGALITMLAYEAGVLR